jgi:hypothetical protein
VGFGQLLSNGISVSYDCLRITIPAGYGFADPDFLRFSDDVTPFIVDDKLVLLTTVRATPELMHMAREKVK